MSKAIAESTIVKAVKDGDTFYTQDGREIRLPGIDSPELSQPYGIEARDTLITLIEGKTVILNCNGDCTYGRYVCQTLLPGTPPLDIQHEMVRRGLAFDSVKFSHGLYKDDETYARAHRFGIWTLPNGGQRPWAYRKQSHQNACTPSSGR